ncbi:hypothetical protein A1E70_RS18885 [Acinetobacter baumannii]|nr:hypothetical protein [Acinetobacter baumannii]EHU1539803.1 hypothetical protein [Acinetobacter baumannii]EHU2002755.1 hypothetical protein [Acinetobacter baumannii]HBM1780202.1 hypothetical protein [Acinetobacter baumannii]HBM2023608.1 hypothetical protein [Acinetobacter baumannii]
MDKPMTFNEWMGKQGNLALVHANCCRIAYEAGQQSQQAKVEELQNNINLLNEALDIKEQLNQKLRGREDELQKQLNEYIFVAETIDEMYVKEVKSSEELQKRMDKAIRLLVEAELYQSEPNIDLAVKALKGEG